MGTPDSGHRSSGPRRRRGAHRHRTAVQARQSGAGDAARGRRTVTSAVRQQPKTGSGPSDGKPLADLPSTPGGVHMILKNLADRLLLSSHSAKLCADPVRPVRAKLWSA